MAATKSLKAHVGARPPKLKATADRRWIFLFVAIPAFIHVMLVWVPSIGSIFLSFAEWNSLSPLSTIKWVGFKNYQDIFTVFDVNLYPALFNNLVLMLWLFLCTALGMLFAYLLDKNIRGTRIYQSVLYLPTVLSGAVVGFIWKGVMFNQQLGLLNKLWPGDNIDFLGDSSTMFAFQLPFLDFPIGLSRNFAAIMIASAWQHVGYIMVLYLAGLKAVDPSLREAASIDGANGWQTFRHVIFPSLKPVNVIVAVITVIQSLRAYDIVAALGSNRGTQVIGTLVISTISGENSGRVGIGSAYAVVLLLLSLGFILYYVTDNFRRSEL